ncbi:hypothetical protein F383_38280 [Gossypium arboreum]|uniref:Uncharacterized protein n=1 Tax=Gossypium arboreum TaxID=29729 RepID=A0A0B0MFG9_GOSAR|nr:hypothetical protein F383_38280 [Gossypium arboreum]
MLWFSQRHWLVMHVCLEIELRFIDELVIDARLSDW